MAIDEQNADATTALTTNEQSTEVVAHAVPKLRLSRPHVLIQRTMDLKPEKDAYGLVHQPAWPGVDLRVSKQQKRNALIVMDRLFRSLESLNIKIEVYAERYEKSGTFAVRDRDKTQLYVSEGEKKVPHVATPKELREKEQRSYFNIPKWDTVHTGKLTLHPGGVVDLSSEDTLSMLIAKATDDVVHILDQEQDRRQAAEAAQKQEWQRQKEQQDEKARIEALHKSADALHRYRLLMDYIEEVRRFGRVPDDQRREGQSLNDWLQWAEWQARIIHPIG
jgi:hypothetical protein